MKACLNCQTEYQPKRDTSKFCSDKCRVSYNRKNPKKGAVTPIQMQVLYNAVLDMVGNISGPTIKYLDPVSPQIQAAIINDRNKNQFTTITTQKVPKTVPQYMKWKRECENDDEWQRLLKDLEENYILNKKQKDFVKTANPSEL